MVYDYVVLDCGVVVFLHPHLAFDSSVAAAVVYTRYVLKYDILSFSLFPFSSGRFDVWALVANNPTSDCKITLNNTTH